MNKIRMLNRFGLWETREWDFDPALNTEWAQRARDILAAENVAGQVTEVAPLCFWYSTDAQEWNVHKWE